VTMTTQDDGFISTSKLAKDLGLQVSSVFAQLHDSGLVEKNGDKWALTEAGKQRGAKYLSSPKYGTWIVWPKNIIKVDSGIPDAEAKSFTEIAKEAYIHATALGRSFGIPAKRMNYILSELGWIQKSLKGWKVTSQGSIVGGVQREDTRSGIPYVAWPDSIAENNALKNTIADLQGTSITAKVDGLETSTPEAKDSNFRERFPAKFRATDGHFVRSRSEMLIDNWLYMAEIVHAYERKLPIEEDVYCDFYVPAGKLYIEFWGMENDPKYAERMKIKRALYAKYGFNLIDLNDEDVHNLDDILPAKLLKHDVQAY
jgi:Mn-dependent DtxR family transcriptional regulator